MFYCSIVFSFVRQFFTPRVNIQISVTFCFTLTHSNTMMQRFYGKCNSLFLLASLAVSFTLIQKLKWRFSNMNNLLIESLYKLNFNVFSIIVRIQCYESQNIFLLSIKSEMKNNHCRKIINQFNSRWKQNLIEFNWTCFSI